MNATASNVANEPSSGFDQLSQLVECDDNIPVELLPNTIRYNQIILFKPDGESLNQQPAYLTFNLNHKEKQREARQSATRKLAERLGSHAATEKLPGVDAPTQEIRRMVREIGDELSSVRIGYTKPLFGSKALQAVRATTSDGPVFVRLGLPDLEASDEVMRAAYVDWLADQKRQELIEMLEPLTNSGVIVPSDIPVEVDEITSSLEEVLSRTFLDNQARPLSDPQPTFALCVTFEQEWNPIGYSRGELINNLSLAPGEQLTLEFHSWDKRTVKSEEELYSEQEMSSSQSLTERDSQTVTREQSYQQGSSFHGGFNVPIPKTPVTVGAGFEVSEDINRSITDVNERTQERTVEVANRVKNTHKMRVEIARDIGLEQKQTRTIANTNRCHTLNCHYFEVLANYLVATRPVSIDPCLLFPNPKPKVTPSWVLCHEDVLRGALRDRTYLPGIRAAHYLEYRRQLTLTRIQAFPVTIEIDNQAGFTQEAIDRQHVQIQADYRELTESLLRVKQIARESFDFSPHPDVWSAYVVAKAGLQQVKQALYYAKLLAGGDAMRLPRSVEEGSTRDNPLEELSDVLSLAVLVDQSIGEMDSAALNQGLQAVGLSKQLVDSLIEQGYVDLSSLDDAGLSGDLETYIHYLEPTLEEQEPDIPGGAGAGSPAGGGGPSPGGGGVPQAPDLETWGQTAEKRELAEARVSFNQLKCHIEDYWPHYFQAIWLHEHPEVRMGRLENAFGDIATIIRNEIVGFLGVKAAYPVVDEQELQVWLAERLPDLEDYPEAIAQVLESANESAPRPQQLSLPTQGIVLEAVVGECNGCEDFIRRSRLIDLRVQEARAEQDEAEARRQEMRLEQEPPLLDDPHQDGSQGAIRVILEPGGGEL